MNLVNEAMLCWCFINFPFTLLFYVAGDVRIGSVIFLTGFLILGIVGLFQAHKEYIRRNNGNR